MDLYNIEMRGEEKKKEEMKAKQIIESPSVCDLKMFCVYSGVSFLTGSARLFGDRQGDLGEGKDVDLGAILGGRRGQGGQICLVLLSLSVFKLLVQRHMLGLVIQLAAILPLRQWETMVQL